MLKKMIKDLVQEGMAARASYQVWFVLRQEAFPDYEETIKQRDYCDFFDLSGSAHYKLIIISLAKIFDTNKKVSSINNLKKALKQAKRYDLETYIALELEPQEEICEKVRKIRNKLTAHNEKSQSRKEVYKSIAIKPNEIHCLVEKTCDVINYVAGEFGINSIFTSDRVKKSTLNVLTTLKAGKNAENN